MQLLTLIVGALEQSPLFVALKITGTKSRAIELTQNRVIEGFVFIHNLFVECVHMINQYLTIINVNKNKTKAKNTISQDNQYFIQQNQKKNKILDNHLICLFLSRFVYIINTIGMKKSRKDFPTFLKYKYYILSNKFENFRELYQQNSLSYSKPVACMNEIDLSQIHQKSQRQNDQSKISMIQYLQKSKYQQPQRIQNFRLDLIKENSEKEFSQSNSKANQSQGQKLERMPQSDLSNNSLTVKSKNQKQEEQRQDQQAGLSDDSDDEEMLKNRQKCNQSRRSQKIVQKLKIGKAISNLQQNRQNELNKIMAGREIPTAQFMVKIKQEIVTEKLSQVKSQSNQNILPNQQINNEVGPVEMVQSQNVFDKCGFNIQAERDEGKFRDINIQSNYIIRNKEIHESPSQWEESILRNIPSTRKQEKVEKQVLVEESINTSSQKSDMLFNNIALPKYQNKTSMKERENINDNLNEQINKKAYSQKFQDLYEKKSQDQYIQKESPKKSVNKLTLFEQMQKKFEEKMNRKWMLTQIPSKHQKQISEEATQTDESEECLMNNKQEIQVNEIKDLKAENQYIKEKMIFMEKQQQKILQLLTKQTLILQRLQQELLEKSQPQRKKLAIENLSLQRQEKDFKKSISETKGSQQADSM